MAGEVRSPFTICRRLNYSGGCRGTLARHHPEELQRAGWNARRFERQIVRVLDGQRHRLLRQDRRVQCETEETGFIRDGSPGRSVRVDGDQRVCDRLLLVEV